MRRPTVPKTCGDAFSMTPMIDVIFLLIIFFLCVNQYQKAESSEAVDLPDATSEKVQLPTEARETRLTINVLADGTILLAGRRIEPGRLTPLLTGKRAEVSPGTLEVWIRGDRRTAYRTVEPILLACAESGIWKVAFKVVQPAPAAEPK